MNETIVYKNSHFNSNHPGSDTYLSIFVKKLCYAP